MRRARYVCTAALVTLVVSALACNAPTPTPLAPSPPLTVTPYIAGTVPAQETAPPTQTVPAEATAPPPTPTETPTPTPSLPTSTPTPTRPPLGAPLVIGDPGFEIVNWRKLETSGEWEGYLRIIFYGGVPPYSFALENRPAQSDNYLYIRWRKCTSAPLTAHVWSADGQVAHKGIWVVSPWCDE